MSAQPANGHDKVNILLVDDSQAKLLSHEVVLAEIGGDPVSVGIALAYPLLDLLLVASSSGVGGLSGWTGGTAPAGG